jgi:SAM-dependent methyltransferase
MGTVSRRFGIGKTVWMSHHELIPPNVGEHEAALLRRAYALSTQAEGAQLYSEWASTYDRTMVDGLGYTSPGLLTDLFARCVAWRDQRVLDLGCGTGLVGAQLVRHGYSGLPTPSTGFLRPAISRP